MSNHNPSINQMKQQLENLDAETIKKLLLESMSDKTNFEMVSNLLSKRDTPSEKISKKPQENEESEEDSDKIEKRLKEAERNEDDPLMLMDDIFEVPSNNLEQQQQEEEEDKMQEEKMEIEEEEESKDQDYEDLERIKKLKEYQDKKLREGQSTAFVSLGALEVDENNNAQKMSMMFKGKQIDPTLLKFMKGEGDPIYQEFRHP